jgi:hypothetical protein
VKKRAGDLPAPSTRFAEALALAVGKLHEWLVVAGLY